MRALAILRAILRAFGVVLVARSAIRGDLPLLAVGLAVLAFDLAADAWIRRCRAETEATFARAAADLEATRASLPPELRASFDAAFADYLRERKGKRWNR